MRNLKNNDKRAATCPVCGRKFNLWIDDHYIARGDKRTGAVAAIADVEVKLYDAQDCPFCGCQVILQERKRALEEDAEMIENDCEGCVRELFYDDEDCRSCRRGWPDNYEPKKEAEDDGDK